MTRRGRYSHKVTRHDLKAGPATLSGEGLTILVSLGSGSLLLGGATADMAFGDVVFTEGEPAVAGTQEILIAQLNLVA
jgi:hypothetical protein